MDIRGELLNMMVLYKILSGMEKVLTVRKGVCCMLMSCATGT